MTEAEAFAAIALAAVAADGKIRQDEASALRKVSSTAGCFVR